MCLKIVGFDIEHLFLPNIHARHPKRTHIMQFWTMAITRHSLQSTMDTVEPKSLSIAGEIEFFNCI